MLDNYGFKDSYGIHDYVFYVFYDNYDSPGTNNIPKAPAFPGHRLPSWPRGSPDMTTPAAVPRLRYFHALYCVPVDIRWGAVFPGGRPATCRAGEPGW